MVKGSEQPTKPEQLSSSDSIVLTTFVSILKFLAILLLIAGVIVGGWLSSNAGIRDPGFLYFIGPVLIALVPATLLYVAAELIQLLIRVQNFTYVTATNSFLMITDDSTDDAMASVSTQSKTNRDSLYALGKRAAILLEDGDWQMADDVLNQALNINPEDSDLYIAKICAKYHLPNRTFLSKVNVQLKEDRLYARALQYANEATKLELEIYGLSDSDRAMQRQHVEEFLTRISSMQRTDAITDVFSSMEDQLPIEFALAVKKLFKDFKGLNMVYGGMSSVQMKKTLNDFAKPYVAQGGEDSI